MLTCASYTLIVLPLIMKTEKNTKYEKLLKFTQFCNF